jgi:hypothetical protein
MILKLRLNAPLESDAAGEMSKKQAKVELLELS